jgi:hypothetical protein
MSGPQPGLRRVYVLYYYDHRFLADDDRFLHVTCKSS